MFVQHTATAPNGKNKPLLAFITFINRCFSKGTAELWQNTHLRLEAGFEKIPYNDSLLPTGKLMLRSPPSLFLCTAPCSMTYSLPPLGCGGRHKNNNIIFASLFFHCFSMLNWLTEASAEHHSPCKVQERGREELRAKHPSVCTPGSVHCIFTDRVVLDS